MRVAVVSGAFGEAYEALAEVSFPLLEAYARKCGADFVRLERRYPHLAPHFERFQLRDLLGRYDAALWVDADILLSPHAPSIFAIVPRGSFAAVEDEGIELGFPWLHELETYARALGVSVGGERAFRYFNSGLFVTWRGQERLFAEPEPHVLGLGVLYDQTLLNVRVLAMRVPFFPLDQTWNVFWSAKRPPSAPKAIHFAGCPKTPGALADFRRTAERLRGWYLAYVCESCGGAAFGGRWIAERPSRFHGRVAAGSHVASDGTRHVLVERAFEHPPVEVQDGR